MGQLATRVVLPILAAAMLLVAFRPGFAADQIELKLGHVAPTNNPYHLGPTSSPGAWRS